MYVPAHFNAPDLPPLHALMRAHPLGVLITHGEGGLDANHLPFELDSAQGEFGTLRAHVARANPVWQQLANGSASAQVLVVFRAAQAYISPNWYPSKHAHHKQVPTWNYQVVHAHGRIQVRDDERYLRGLVGRLTRSHEASEPKPWTMAQSPREHIDALLTAIVGLEITVTRLEGKFKLSQNKDEADRLGAADALQQRGEATQGDQMALGVAMRSAKPFST